MRAYLRSILLGRPAGAGGVVTPPPEPSTTIGQPLGLLLLLTKAS